MEEKAPVLPFAAQGPLTTPLSMNASDLIARLDSCFAGRPVRRDCNNDGDAGGRIYLYADAAVCAISARLSINSAGEE